MVKEAVRVAEKVKETGQGAMKRGCLTERDLLVFIFRLKYLDRISSEIISLLIRLTFPPFYHTQSIIHKISTMQNLENFIFTQVLITNETEKILYLLGTVKGKQGEAIVILTPRLINPTSLHFQNPQTAFINDIYHRFTASIASDVDIQFIYPINEKHKNKYRSKEMEIHYESGEEYAARKEEILKKELAHIQWVNNIIEGKSEAERVLYKDDDFLVVPDFKYTDLADIKKLHLNALFSDPKLNSLRDLTGQHIPLLQRFQTTLNNLLSSKFGLHPGKVRLYFHYPPTFYRLHIHIMHLSLESLSCRVERCHDFNLVLQNIRMRGSYYQEVTLNTFVQSK